MRVIVLVSHKSPSAVLMSLVLDMQWLVACVVPIRRVNVIIVMMIGTMSRLGVNNWSVMVDGLIILYLLILL